MNKSAFLHLIHNASSISTQEAEELEELVVNFPYCQTAHLLIAKAAYDRGSMLSNQKLRKAASYATNRQLLKKLIYTTSADVTLREVSELAVAEEAQVSAPEPTLSSAPAETAPLLKDPEPAVEEQQEIASPEPDFNQNTVSASTEEVAEEPVLGQIILEEAEPYRPETPAVEPLLQEQTIANDLKAEPELTDTDPVLEDKPLVLAQPPEPAAEKEEAAVEAYENGAEEENEELHDELAGLLYIDRIMPYRHELPEQEETLEEDVEPILLPQYANPTLTEEEITALEEFFNPKREEKEENMVSSAEAEVLGEEVAPVANSLVEPVEPIEVEEEVVEEREPELAEEDTLSRFDAFLFNPERDTVEQLSPAKEEEITATYPADVIDRIYTQNQLGYWMNSSRLGESLEVKNELTWDYPFHFYPELILEYVQVNEVEKQVKPVGSPLDHQLDLIDQFLKMNPRLKQFGDAKVRSEPQEDLSYKSSKIKKTLASENLASIFLKQGKIKKAIKIYEHLIVKIPEKKAYFADQIQKLKDLT